VVVGKQGLILGGSAAEPRPAPPSKTNDIDSTIDLIRAATSILEVDYCHYYYFYYYVCRVYLLLPPLFPLLLLLLLVKFSPSSPAVSNTPPSSYPTLFPPTTGLEQRHGGTVKAREPDDPY